MRLLFRPRLSTNTHSFRNHKITQFLSKWFDLSNWIGTSNSWGLRDAASHTRRTEFPTTPPRIPQEVLKCCFSLYLTMSHQLRSVNRVKWEDRCGKGAMCKEAVLANFMKYILELSHKKYDKINWPAYTTAETRIGQRTFLLHSLSANTRR